MARDPGVQLRMIGSYLLSNLNQEEKHRLQYLYDVPDTLHNQPIEKTFDYLEKKRGLFSPSNPEGLVTIAENLERKDLEESVKARVKEYREMIENPDLHPFLVHHPELKYQYESTLKLCPLLKLHLSKLKSSLVQIAKADPKKPNPEGIQQSLKEAEEYFKKGEEKLLRACRATGFKPSRHNKSQLSQCQAQETEVHSDDESQSKPLTLSIVIATSRLM